MPAAPSLLAAAVAAAFAISAPGVRAQPLSLAVRADASYAVSFAGKVRLESASDGGGYMARWNGATHTTADGSLKLDAAPGPISGNDAVLGAYTGYSATFNQGVVGVTFKLFPAASALLLTQTFPRGLVDMATGSDDDLCTGFPVFGEPDTDLNDNATGFVSWSGGMSPGHTGTWTKDRVGFAALGSQSGAPLALFDAARNTVVISPASDFMTAQLAFGRTVGGRLGSGFNGRLTSVPAGWAYDTLIVAGAGVTSTVKAWGDIMLARGGKTRAPAGSDIIISTLGWWSDNGACRGT